MRDKKGPPSPPPQKHPTGEANLGREAQQQQQQRQQQQQQHFSRRRSRQSNLSNTSSASDGSAAVVVSAPPPSSRRRRRSLEEDFLAASSSSFFPAAAAAPLVTAAGKLPPNIHKKTVAEREAATAAELLLPPPPSPPSPRPSSPKLLFFSSSKKSNGLGGVPSSSLTNSLDLSDMSLPEPGPALSSSVKAGLKRSVSLSSSGDGGNSRANAIGSIFILSLLLCSGYFLRDYIRWVLVAAEHQDDAVVIVILWLLYAVVSLPFAWGYILINIATGYLYGVFKGTLVTIITATAGVFVAHHLIRACMAKYVRRWLVYSSTLSESLDAVMSSKQQAFKIVLLSRLTPVPFGIQNAIFAVNCSLSTSRYLQATMIGLLPCQVINAYLGSTFRSMEQLLSDSETTQVGAIILGAQLAVAVGVTYFVVKRARQELDKSLLAKEKMLLQQGEALVAVEELEAEAEMEEAERETADVEKGELRKLENGFMKGKLVEHI